MEKIKFHSENNRIVEVLATPVFGEGEEIDGIVIRVDDITNRENDRRTEAGEAAGRTIG